MAWSDLQVSLVGFSGNTLTVSVHNPQSHSETARARAGASLANGDHATLTSANFTLAAGETRSLQLGALSTIVSITDGPEPIEPM